jgi:hypothetical protein
MRLLLGNGYQRWYTDNATLCDDQTFVNRKITILRAKSLKVPDNRQEKIGNGQKRDKTGEL